MPYMPSVLNVKVVVAAFNQDKDLVGAFSVIIQLQTSRRDEGQQWGEEHLRYITLRTFRRTDSGLWRT